MTEQTEITMREYIDANLADVRRAVDKAEQAAQLADKGEIISLRDHLSGIIDHLQQQLDRRIEQQQHELADAKELLGNKIDALDQRVETTFTEHRYQQQTAEQEREKSAVALRQEQATAMDVAEREREKAAVQLRSNLEKMILEGDTNLRTHIQEQIRSVESALRAQGVLGDEKDKRLDAIRVAAQEAIDKAERSMERRLDSVNEFRAQLSDQATQFVPREVFEALTDAHEKRLATMEGWRASEGGRREATTRSQDRVQPWHLAVAGTGMTLVIALIIALANILTTTP